MQPESARPLRVLTWHVHGNYLYYLTRSAHRFWVVTDAARSPGYAGLGGRLPWGERVQEAPLERLHAMQFDCVLTQCQRNYEIDRMTQLSDAQRRLPHIHLEHDPPQEHPTNTRHFVQERSTLLVHCTHFNALMWDSGITPTRVIEHGVQLPKPAHYSGHRARGIAVVNHLTQRGRRLGADVFESVRAQVPLDLVGMASHDAGGLGEIANDELANTMAAYRFFFNPIRYTSLGLSVIEAMMVGLPIIGLATTEMVTVVRNGVNGFVETNVAALVEHMRRLLADPAQARSLGEAARRAAQERFNIGRFAADWDAAFREVAG
ncbi:MAG TPA: glycosyltransferase family 4 protein [Burkholderiales bacterium]|nr:glycosyltransferase family 4 protein [Burkholderiales bacterium]